MSTNLSKFNEQLLNFLNEISSLFPEDKALKTFCNTVEFIKKTNPRELMNQFKKFVYPYKEQIIKKDESFFLDNSFNDIVKGTEINGINPLAEMMRIKTIWVSGQLSPKDKECIWNYFKVFIYLIEKEYK
jgi:hypothetical protein